MTKYVDIRQHPSLELGMMFIFAYAPYGLAEGLQLSGTLFVEFFFLFLNFNDGKRDNCICTLVLFHIPFSLAP